MKLHVILMGILITVVLAGCWYTPIYYPITIIITDEDSQPVARVGSQLRRDGEIVDGAYTGGDGRTTFITVKGRSDAYMTMQEFRKLHTIHLSHPDFEYKVVVPDQDTSTYEVQLTPLGEN